MTDYHDYTILTDGTCSVCGRQAVTLCWIDNIEYKHCPDCDERLDWENQEQMVAEVVQAEDIGSIEEALDAIGFFDRE